MSLELLKEDAKRAFAEKNYERAAELYTECLKEGDDYVIYSNRCACYTALYRLEEAHKDALKTVELKPDWARGYSRLGTVLKEKGMTLEAKEAFETGLKYDPNNQVLKDGIKACSGVDAGDSHVWEMVMSDHRVRVMLQDEEFRNKLFTSFQDGNLEKYGSDPKIKQLMDIYFEKLSQLNGQSRAEDRKEAEKREEQREEPKKTEADLTREEIMSNSIKDEGNEFYKNKDFENALDKYQQAIELNPSNFSVYNNIAAVYFEQKSYDLCIEECNKLIEMNNERSIDSKILARCCERKGNAHARKEEYEEALESYKKSLINQESKTVRQKLREAERLLEEKKKRDRFNPEEAEKHRLEGNRYFESKNYVRAVKHYDEAIALNESDVRLYSNRSVCLLKLKSYMECIRDCDKCISIDPKHTKSYLRKAMAYKELKRYPEAINVCDELKCACGPNSEAESFIASCYSDMKNVPSMSPDDPEIQALLSDPYIMFIVKKMETEPGCIYEYMKNPELALRINKLIAAGIIRTG